MSPFYINLTLVVIRIRTLCRALLDLYAQRLAGAMEQTALYRSMADGAQGDHDVRDASVISQLEAAQQVHMCVCVHL